MKNTIYIILTVFLTGFLVSGCSTKKEKQDIQTSIEKLKGEDILIEENLQKERFEKVSFSQIEGFFEDDLNHALDIFKKDCIKSKRFEEFKNVCAKAENISDGRMFFVTNFQPYKLYDNKSSDEGMITGYYEPLLYGSLKKTARYKYPVYKVPKNLVRSNHQNLKAFKSRGKLVKKRVVPYETREQIEKNPNNKNLEAIAYVDNKFDLFFLHVQGSGKIQLENGEIINVGFGEQNGHPYFGIGAYLVNEGYMTKEEMSAQAMKSFFKENPSRMDEIFNLNKSYIFFTVAKNGATGSLGSVLSAKRNIAVDRSHIPLGMPVFLNTTNPVTKEPINQLMVAADVGGAIKGEIRADFFWGFGEDAFEYAGRMKEKGKMYILKPKE